MSNENIFQQVKIQETNQLTAFSYNYILVLYIDKYVKYQRIDNFSLQLFTTHIVA